MPFTDILIRRFVKDASQSETPEVRARYAMLEAWVSIVGNLLVFVLQLVLGLVANSVTLLANAFHSLGDLVSSAVVLVGARAARRPADRRHPYGHGRAEPIATLVIAMLLVITAVEFAHLSYQRLFDAKPIKASAIVVVAMVASIVAKEWMARFSNRLAAVIGSDMLRADAWHHRSDAVAAGLVILAVVGVGLGYPWVDGVFGFGVSGLIGLTGYHMGRKMISVLLGEAPAQEVMEQIVAAATSVRGVQGVHSVEVHDYSSSKHVALHVEVAPESLTEDSHEIANSVEKILKADLNMDAVVHVDLADSAEPASGLNAVRAALDELKQSHDPIRAYHGLHAVSDQHGQYVEFHLLVDPAVSLAKSHDLVHEVSQQVRDKTGMTKVNIHVEPAEH